MVLLLHLMNDFLRLLSCLLDDRADDLPVEIDVLRLAVLYDSIDRDELTFLTTHGQEAIN